MKNRILSLCLFLSAAFYACAGEPRTVNLWPAGNPNDNGNPGDQLAEMTIYRPDNDKDCGIAVAILAGGS